ncbi:hypothetical protein HK096_007013 [Nowakowskiella sp. JEL0078]|nr:hypothetical protein HK096_007013 [Nowakowskiella sp. JEL0078]
MSNHTTSDNLTLDDGPWIPLQDSNLYNVILWTPFIAIPFGIIMARLFRYIWRIYKAKRAGYGDDVINDPLTELGLNLHRSYDDLTEIRKIRKERAKLLKWEAKQAKMRMKQQELSGMEASGTGKIWMQNLAENYIMGLRKRTQETWSEKLSPTALRHLMSTGRWGRLWMVFQVLCTIFAIINYILLTYSIQRTDRKLIKIIDIILATFFLMDYCLSFYIADDRLRFYFDPTSLIDLMSVVPPFVYVFVSDTSKYVWFLGLLRIFRASRILRTYRLLSFSESEEKREMTILGLTFLNFVFLSASIINALETLEIDLKQPPSLLYWHDSLYYIMVTFSTIGFGDLTPSSIPSRFIVMCLIIFVIVYVPLQTTRLLEFYNMTSPFQRARYTLSSTRNSHVILSGCISYTALIDFCREYFASDDSGHIVILVQEEPSLEIKRMLRHPFYRTRVFFLNGSSLNLADLKRANATCATALFLLNTEGSTGEDNKEEEQLRMTRGADAEILMRSLVAKTNFPDLAIFAQVEDIRSQDLSSHCGISRVLCLDEIKMSLLARNCLVPGLLTLMLNLVHTYRNLNDNTLDSKWMREYNQGSTNQIYAFKIPSGLVGFRFAEMVNFVYCTFGVTIFAIIGNQNERKILNGDDSKENNNSHRIKLNPGRDYIVKDSDVALCIATGGDATILRVVFQFKEPPSPETLPKSAFKYKFNLDRSA